MFKGTVIHGDKIGRTLGFPTANLDISIKDTKCKPGIYAAFIVLKNKKHKAALIINDSQKKIEVYLFDYDGEEFYGAQMEVDPIQKVSELESHDTVEDLKKKIDADILLVRKVLKL